MKLFDKLSGKEFEVSTSLGNTFLKHNHIKNGGRYCLPKEVHKYTDELGLEEVEETMKDSTTVKASESNTVRDGEITVLTGGDGHGESPEFRTIESDETTEPDISAAARKLAENNGIDWRKVKGSGKDGMIVKSDINDLI